MDPWAFLSVVMAYSSPGLIYPLSVLPALYVSSSSPVPPWNLATCVGCLPQRLFGQKGSLGLRKSQSRRSLFPSVSRSFFLWAPRCPKDWLFLGVWTLILVWQEQGGWEWWSEASWDALEVLQAARAMGSPQLWRPQTKQESMKMHLQVEVKTVTFPVCPLLNEMQSHLYDGRVSLYQGF